MNPLSQFVIDIIEFVNGYLIPLLFALAFAMFLWGVFKYFFASQSDEGRTEGKKFIAWGVVALAVMFAVWGLVNFLLGAFGFERETRPCLPTFSGPCNPGAPGDLGTNPQGGATGM